MKKLLLLILPAALTVPTAAPRDQAVPRLSHVVVIVFENKEITDIVGNPNAPTLNSLARRGAAFAQYHAVAHPSLPNYLALVSGSTHGIRTSCTDCLIGARSLADTFNAAKIDWKTYAEGLPRPGWPGARYRLYAKRHNPFLYFRSVLADASRRRRVLPLTRLRADVAARRLPAFSLVVPDLCNSMHDCSIATGDRWLARQLRLLLASPQLRRGVVFVIFDEGSSSVGGGGHIAAYAVGPAVRRGAMSAQRLSHYSLLATVETAWRLPRLGASRAAAPIFGIWKPR